MLYSGSVQAPTVGAQVSISLACKGATMTPLRAKMVRDMQLQWLAPRTQEAYVAAVAGLAKFSQRSPDQLSPEQIRTS